MKYRPYLVPLQAFIAIFLCTGIAWMVVVMAGFNPNPPTAMEIKMRSTADVSLVSLNSTAAALAVQMVSEYMPTAIVLPPTVAVEITAIPTSTLSYVLIPVSGPSQTPSPTPFSLRSLLFPPTKNHDPDPTRTPILRPTAATTSTNTLVPTLVPTSTRTATARPTVTVPTSTLVPTHTATPVPPTATTAPPPTETNTSVPPTDPPPTDTSEPPPTSTNEPPPTSEPPTDTPNPAP